MYNSLIYLFISFSRFFFSILLSLRVFSYTCVFMPKCNSHSIITSATSPGAEVKQHVTVHVRYEGGQRGEEKLSVFIPSSHHSTSSYTTLDTYHLSSFTVSCGGLY